MEDDYTGGDICIDGSTDCTGNDIVHGSRTDIHLKKASPVGGAFIYFLTIRLPFTITIPL